VPFRNGHDQLGGTGGEVVPWGYSYLPLVGGGIAFTYDLSVHGHLISNLRLSGTTLMKIFTGQITNWDDPQITRDYGTRLPDLPITPVIHSDGAGTTYYFTRWMAHVFPRQWNAFCDHVHPGIKPPCGQTEFYPLFGHAHAENGSVNVASYIASGRHNGAIGYDEYAYVAFSHLPVLKLQNPAGDYVPPTPGHVTTALTQAVINTDPNSPDYLQENLNKLYTYKNPASYLLSYYGYLIVPRAGTKPLPPNFTKARGYTLSAFIVFALCRGQVQTPSLGYAPLPGNLVKGGLQQVRQIPGHGPVPSPSQCR
jgi:ABC-type phosphate transport system substrate-binding protein